MKLIILNRGRRAARCVDLSAISSWIAGGLVVAVFGVVVFAGFGLARISDGSVATDEVVELQAELIAQQAILNDLKVQADEQIDALALRMGQLNANVIRLNALGTRLTGMADLDDGEFDFQNPPAIGGPALVEESPAANAGQLPDLLKDFDLLAATLDDQEQQLAALEGLLLDQRLNERVNPSGRPIKSGWLSSYFGKRSDPISGKSSWHRGIDFAGKFGNDIIAVGDGVVSWSGDRYGYGNMVEIKHGNGYVTRYGHNQKNLVAIGDQVDQGQTIALMGSTGRSTGPHVHFEVWRNGKAVDPTRYVHRR
ncbi:MAG: M23 family metallopeptidase [Gammaproteobacteria bacterium]|jgi:murein DD-endopeptidase MepM/ murein hydrolase activator NlpD|nr:M23 family metallopeptidase [Gammaproteobacteria bacterium]MDP6615573.1 M23 family metallopeptidase [Gammaproteobacteria bacterium]MDP6694753.1 M23 family metallopeptidase [Gammaproteobacteria bacterium]MDP7041624.1 M23 family metallopeptidase [Gammaproteobacteria bacterium]